MEQILVLANRHPGEFRPGHRGEFGPGHSVVGADGFGLVRPMLSLLIIGLMVALIVLLIMNMRRPRGLSPLPAGPSAPSGPDPLETARMRYAKGEITRDEYVGLVGDLTGSNEEESNPNLRG